MPETWPGHLPRPIAIIGWDGTRYSAFRLRPGGTVQVRGEDQLHSFHSVLALSFYGAISGNDGYIDSSQVPAGLIWHITRVAARDATTAPTAMTFRVYHDLVGVVFEDEIRAFAVNEWHALPAEFWMDVDDYVRVNFVGGLAGDNVGLELLGEVFSKET